MFEIEKYIRKCSGTNRGFSSFAKLPAYDATQMVRREVMRKLNGRTLIYLTLAALIFCLSMGGLASAQEATRTRYSIPAGPAGATLPVLARKGQVSILYDFEVVSPIETNSVFGEFSFEEALDRMLRGTSLSGDITSNGIIRITVQSQNEEGNVAVAKDSTEQNSKIRKGLFASVSAGVLTVLAPMNPALAQEDAAAEEDRTLDVVSVVGIRGAIERGVDIKKNSDAFVDAISAEGIGAFPDTNLAEALQRISGVSIDRSGGEGEFVSVRGFGPEFNTVLFNGRQMPTTNGGRDFSFDIIASEMVSTLQVYKTSPVNLQAGGIGSTIDIQTPKPLDRPGFNAGFSIDGLYEDSSEELTPRLFGSISNTFANDTIGLYLAATYQERDARIEEARTNGYNQYTVGNQLTGAQFAGTAPADGTLIFAPTNFDYWVNNEKRERIGINGVGQWQASPDLLVTADVLYAELNVESQADALAQWFGVAGLHQNIQLDGNNTYTSFERAGGFSDFVQRSFNRPDETMAYGLNFDWDVSDTVNVTLDLSTASAESDNGGNDVFAVIGRPQAVLGYALTGEGTIPTITGLPADLGTNFNENLLHAALRQTVGGDPNGGSYKDDVDELRLDMTWSPAADGPLSEVRAGLLYSEREKDNRQFATPAGARTFYAGYFQSAPASLFSTVNASGFLSENGGGAVPGSYVGFDAEELFAYLESDEATSIWDTNPRPSVSAVPLPPGSGRARLDSFGGYAAQETGASFNVQEEILDAYLDFTLDGEFGGNPWTLTAGARYTKTDVVAVGTQQDLVDLQFISVGSILDAIFGPDPVEARDTNEYEEVLPNVTFKYEPMEDVILRAAYTHTLTRPSPLDLAPRLSFGILRDDVRTGSSGNTQLDPFLSKNLDFSVEWYPSADASFYAAYFRKDTDGFIVNGVNTIQVDLVDPNSPFRDISVSQPVNGPSAVIDGFELGFNYAFTTLPEPFDGLGVQANATFVESDEEFSLQQLLTNGESFGIEGISNTTNIVVYYDKGPFEARVAWNQRDDFLQTLANSTGGLPINVAEYAQWDARVSYDVLDNATIYLEGVNLGNETVERYSAFRNQFLGVIDSGPRYSFGVRATF